MFGKFVLSFLAPLLVGAAQTGTVTAEQSYIYATPDFDAQIIATVNQGEMFDISDNTKGPFYRIRLKDKRLGWISSVDIKPGQIKVAPSHQPSTLASYREQRHQESTLLLQRWQGPRLELLDWKEKTLGKVRHDQLNLVGWGWTGMDTLWKGPFFFDSSASFAWQPPDYYKKITGVSAEGWVLKLQSALLTPRPLGENFLYFYGVGPVATFSHFEAGLLVNGKVKKYQLDDLTIGIQIPVGLIYRVSSTFAVSAWYRFYWEKQTTSSLSLGVQFKF